MVVEERKNIAAQRSNTLGALISYDLDTFGFYGKTESEKIGIEVFGEGIVRVRITRNDNFDSFNYALEDDLKRSALDYLEKDNSLIISTGLIELCILKSPLRLIFKDNKGKVLNEDDPAFATSWLGEQVTTYKKLQPNEKFLGLGEKTGPLNKRGMGFQNWNTDHFAYGLEDDPIYCSVPFYIGIHNRKAYGIYFNNSHKSHFNFGASNNRFSSFSADSGDMDYFFIHDKNIAGIIKSYTNLTGRMSLPPKWSIGYQQCRYSYYPDQEVLSTAKNFRDKAIPADVIVLDIHYMEKYKMFTWDGEQFPDPEQMIARLKELGFKVVVMCDPGIKIEQDYDTYHSGLERDVFIKYPDGSNYEGQVWPGWCHFPDYTNPNARAWWEDQLKAYSDMGIEGYWNDMNEIATWGQSLPDLIEFDFDGEGATARAARNIYGLMMAKSTFDGAKRNLKGNRPFNLTRAGFAGIQKYAAVWTGDIMATDEHMMLGVRMLSGMGLSGIPFVGFDAGGFKGNGSSDLFARWISIGAFTPFFRGHSDVNTKSSEPWSHGEHTEEISRNYISLRYRLMPYIYSIFNEASKSGLPVHRSLAIMHTFDENVFKENYQNQFYLGDAIMVAPVSSEKEIEKIYFPKGGYYDLFTDKKYKGSREYLIECPIEKLPVFIKASSIIPIQSQIYSNQEKPENTLEIHLYKGNKKNSYLYYEDDGTSYAYESDYFYERNISYFPDENALIFDLAQGKYKSNFKNVKVYFHGFGDNELDKLEINKSDYSFIKPLSNYDPHDFNAPAEYKIEALPYLSTTFKKSKFLIEW
jgi:alpha-glucosidase